MAMLEDRLKRLRREVPPPDELTYERERRNLSDACMIFARGEEERRRTANPLHMEVAFGLEPESGTPWDRREPVTVLLPGGKAVRLKGRIDRIDRLAGGGLAILDYKTGGSGKFSRTDLFRQGRQLQPLLYCEMLRRALEEQGRPEEVGSFSYLFPMPRDGGRTIAYRRSELVPGLELAEKLLSLLAAGCFPFSTAAGDAEFSDWLPLFGDAGEAARAARRKALSGGNPELSAWREIRGLTGEDDDDGE